MKTNVFITGIAGCVGHYLFDILSKNADCDLYLLIRNPGKLLFDPSKHKNVIVIADDMANINNHADLLKQMDYVIHMAPDWGGIEGNYNHTLALFNNLDLNRCKKIICFSTASIIGKDNKPINEAFQCGTLYIKGKAMMHEKLRDLAVSDRTVTLFPTWVLGGDEKHPYSHALLGIKEARKWLWLLRFFTVDAKFHFIHAQDIASITDYLLKSDISKGDFVLGNPPITAGVLIKALCDYYKKKIYFWIRISPDFVKRLAKLVGRELSAWDTFCLDNLQQIYKTVNMVSFGLTSEYSTIEEILKSLD